MLCRLLLLKAVARTRCQSLPYCRLGIWPVGCLRGFWGSHESPPLEIHRGIRQWQTTDINDARCVRYRGLKYFAWRNFGVPGALRIPSFSSQQTITDRETEAEPIVGMIFHVRNATLQITANHA